LIQIGVADTGVGMRDDLKAKIKGKDGKWQKKSDIELSMGEMSLYISKARLFNSSFVFIQRVR